MESKKFNEIVKETLKNSEEILLNSKKILENSKEILNNSKKSTFISIMAILLTMIFAIISILHSQPTNLEVWHEIDKDNERLIIHIKNSDSRFKFMSDTGNIYIYRLEVSDSKPHILIDKPLKPGEETYVNLSINYNNLHVVFPSKVLRYGKECTIPMPEYYFLMENISISYKVSCDTCSGQGVTNRIPDFGAIEAALNIDPKTDKCDGIIPIYSWPRYGLDDLKEIKLKK